MDFVTWLASMGYRVIRFDNRDMGNSTWLSNCFTPRALPTLIKTVLGLDVEAPYTLEDMAQDTALLVSELGYDSAHIVGLSMGGMVAQTFAILYPDMCRSLTSIMSTTGSTKNLLGLRTAKPRALRALLAPAPTSEREMIVRSVNFADAVAGTGFRRSINSDVAIAKKQWKRGYNPQGFLRQLAAMGSSGDRTEKLKHVRLPTLVVHGTEDPMIAPECGSLTAKSNPRSRTSMD